MPSRIGKPSWPEGWPSFTDEDDDPKDTYLQELKGKLVAEYGADALKLAWVKTCKALEDVLPPIVEQGSDAIPIFQYDDVVGTDNAAILDEMRAKGCFIVRGVIPEAEAASEFENLEQFFAQNRGDIIGWPKANPTIFSIYNSPVQLRLRTHANQLKLQRVLNSLFTDSSVSPEEHRAQWEPILYPDALRIRRPGQEFLGLGPHIDGGSISRYADYSYRMTYDKIFSGEPENFDPYDMTHRRDANPAFFPSGVHCSALRTFQGWTALTPCGPGEGGLMLLPDVKVVMAYNMLRPFFRAPPPGDGDWEEAEKWVLDDSTSSFPGQRRWDSQLLSPVSHPHLRLEETLVSCPLVRPGDIVTRKISSAELLCHAVEPQHTGKTPASVVYIPAAPSTPRNKAYMTQYWKDLVAGIPPDDYKLLDGVNGDSIANTQNERDMVGALSLDRISVEGRRALGEGC
ncbi:DUF1479-domain-containing protein [Pleomassaria siparia CBS 279.74]|uniref:DUF1479-domain-containing protein n=1 Tax=Pleomassaria siparia CBS 279.74 TaxID=1314801 RepID=A0A6G1KTA9_9PLEO|nr:DUF1479-domain-containing protein [Pleomassaria siparia CBS 279.74]